MKGFCVCVACTDRASRPLPDRAHRTFVQVSSAFERLLMATGKPFNGVPAAPIIMASGHGGSIEDGRVTESRSRSEGEAMSTGIWIALVDDDLSVRRALPRLLKSGGYETRSFASAQEFVESGLAETASCFLFDIHLDRASGFDLLERLRASGAAAPVIFITAFDDDASRERARALGAFAFLRKPFDGSALLDAIAGALGSRRPNPSANSLP
jgi:CheY-like chemotaxis protein